MKILDKPKLTLSYGSTGVAGTAGTAATLSRILAYTVPLGMNLLLDEDTILQIKDHGATETSDASLVEIHITPANGLASMTLAQTTYSKVKTQTTDAALRFKPVTKALRVRANGILEVWLKSNQTVYAATAGSVDFDLEAKYENA